MAPSVCADVTRTARRHHPIEPAITEAGAGPFHGETADPLPVAAQLVESISGSDADHPGMREAPLAPTRRRFVQAILSGERRAALAIAVAALEQGAQIEDLYADVFQDALYEVGRLWEAHAISVAQEHMATAVTQFVMAHVFARIDSVAATRGLALMTGVPGELHHVGALMVSDMLEARGWQVQFLGSDLPIASIIDAIAATQPRLLGISVTMAANRQQATRLIDQARLAVDGLRVVVGGAAFGGGHWRDSGADDYASDVRGAIALLCPEEAP
jgi:methanogenic corrinoid protein MtbC1